MSMSVALNQQQQLIHIHDAIRGLACECTCFNCHEPVVARKGPTNEHHFAHVSLKESCQISSESVLQLFAKEVVLESKGMIMPSLPDEEGEPATWWDFEEVQSEIRLGLIRPDLVAYCKEEPILIEMAVTHFVDEKKQDILNTLQLKTLEVDLSPLLNPEFTVPSEAAKQWILNQTANKTWLFPPSPTMQTEKTVAESSFISHDNIQPEDKTGNSGTTWQDHQFVIEGMYVKAREFSGGMVAVTCSYNPALIALFKQWRNEGGGRYNPKYKSWEYWQPFSKTVLERLYQMHKPKE